MSDSAPSASAPSEPDSPERGGPGAAAVHPERPQGLHAAAPERRAPVERSPLGWFLNGAWHGISVPALVVFASYTGFGALLHGIGFPLGAGLLSSLLIWALPAQVILVGGLAAGTALPALAVAVGLSSMRLLPMVVSVAPYMRGPRRSLPLELLCAHYVAMTVWVEGLRLLPHLPGEARVAFTLGLGNALLCASLVGTVLGYQMAGQVPAPLAAGLLFLTPLSFSVLMVRNAATLADALPLVAGFAIMPLTLGLDGGLDLLIAGVGGGTIAYTIDRIRRRRP